MAHLRQVVGQRLRRTHQTECGSCSDVLYVFEPFCPTCGADNHNFDREVYDSCAPEPLEQALQACRLRPPRGLATVGHLIDELYTVGTKYDSTYCSLCGERLTPLTARGIGRRFRDLGATDQARFLKLSEFPPPWMSYWSLKQMASLLEVNERVALRLLQRLWGMDLVRRFYEQFWLDPRAYRWVERRRKARGL